MLDFYSIWQLSKALIFTGGYHDDYYRAHYVDSMTGRCLDPGQLESVNSLIILQQRCTKRGALKMESLHNVSCNYFFWESLWKITIFIISSMLQKVRMATSRLTSSFLLSNNILSVNFPPRHKTSTAAWTDLIMFATQVTNLSQLDIIFYPRKEQSLEQVVFYFDIST